MLRALDGGLDGLFLMGQNPAVGSQHAGLQRRALASLKWLVVRDLAEIESATFWRDSPEVQSGELNTQDIQTEVFLMPAASHVEKEGRFTNTQRLVQWRDKALEPPGDARSELWFMHHLGKRVRAHYTGSNRERDWPIQNLTWDLPEHGEHAEPDAEAVVKEINGYVVATGEPVSGFVDLAADGSTACGCWIYSGIYADGVNQARRRDPGDIADPAAAGSRRSGPGPGRPTGASSTTVPRPTPRATRGRSASASCGGTSRPAPGRATTCPTSQSTSAPTTRHPTARWAWTRSPAASRSSSTRTAAAPSSPPTQAGGVALAVRGAHEGDGHAHPGQQAGGDGRHRRRHHVLLQWSYLFKDDTVYAPTLPADGQVPEAARAARAPDEIGTVQGPVIKPAGWTWEIPVYFWTGGIAAGASFVALACDLAGDPRSARVCRAVALGALAPSPALLIMDLGRPPRFLNMLRIFKPRSPMNTGAWALSAFGALGTGAVAADLLGAPRAARGLGAANAVVGGYLGSYTGVLLASTAVPLWARSRLFLGPIFVATAAATGAAACRLTLVARGLPIGHPTREALGTVEMGAMAAELGLSLVNERRLGPTGDHLEHAGPGRCSRWPSTGCAAAWPCAWSAGAWAPARTTRPARPTWAPACASAGPGSRPAGPRPPTTTRWRAWPAASSVRAIARAD
jgi:hypothetical protein